MVANVLRTFQIFFISLVFSSNCSTTSDPTKVMGNQKNESKLQGFEDLRPYLFSKKPDIKTFRNKGPFRYRLLKNYSIRVDKNRLITTDVYFASHKERAPLIIFQHGNLASMNVHRNHARHLASWGMHSMIISQPNAGEWMKNGDALAKLVSILHSFPHLLGKRFDRDRIIVSGHSFGGSAAAIAAGKKAPLHGLILLDPALVDPAVKKYIKRIDVPVIILGADKRIFKSRSRVAFYKFAGGPALEISVKGATHNDAQNPSLFSLPQLIGLEHSTSPDLQEKFTAAITASAFSLATTGSSTYAWRAFQSALKRGDLIQPRRK